MNQRTGPAAGLLGCDSSKLGFQRSSVAHSGQMNTRMGIVTLIEFAAKSRGLSDGRHMNFQWLNLTVERQNRPIFD
jgi:hypothetical protein